jgi:tetratricopeptide (TPR) repeat protein
MHQQERDEFAGNQGQLMQILDFFAERAGEVDTRIALRAKDLSSQWSYLQLAEFCLSHGREEEALRRAEEGLWMFEDGRPDERLVLFTAELLSKAGRKDDAQACLQRAFEKAPSLDLYTRLRKLGGEAARERVVTFLEDKQIRGEQIRWHNPADLLIRVWIHEKMFDAAWAVVRKHGASTALKEALARDSEATRPSEAIEVYAERVDQLANAGGASAYAEAAKLVARMATLRGKAEQVAYVLALKERFGRRRNFVKLLG